MALFKIQITEEDEKTLGFAFLDEKDNHVDWNKLCVEDRSHILAQIATAYRFFYDHLDKDAPQLPEKK